MRTFAYQPRNMKVMVCRSIDMLWMKCYELLGANVLGGALGWCKRKITSAKLSMIPSSPSAGSGSPLLYLASNSFDNISFVRCCRLQMMFEELAATVLVAIEVYIFGVVLNH